MRDVAGGGGVGYVPFDTHSAQTGTLDSQAARLEDLANQAIDLTATTNRAFKPAEASWDGIAAPELRSAPEPIRRDAQEASSAMAWGAVPLRYWAQRVRDFNSRVATIVANKAVDPAQVEGTDGDPPTGDQIADAQREADSEARRQWWEAYNTYILDGAREAAAMFRDGPTAENLTLAYGVGAIPATDGAFAFFPAQWHDANMQQAAGDATELARRINDPYYEPTKAELEQFAALLDEYAEDEAFAYYFLDDLGAEGLLLLTGNVATMQWDAPGDQEDRDLAATVGAIQTSLGIALATATARRGATAGYPGAPYYPGKYELDSQWRADLLTAGRDTIAIGDPNSPARYGEVYGYQLLGVLLNNGDYDASFLGLVGGDMIDFEMAQGDSDFWRYQAAGDNFRLDWTGTDGTDDLRPAGYDPILGLLSALERNPEGALQVFTSTKTFGDVPDYASPPPDGFRLPRLDYLLTDREWPEDVPGGPGYLAILMDNDDYVSPGLASLGRVLEGASALDDPRAVDLVESIVYELNVDEQAMGYDNGDEVGDGKTQASIGHDLMHPELRESIGNIMADYIFDVNRSLDPAGAGLPGGRGAEFADAHMVRLLADLGKEENAHQTIREAEAVYAAASYDFYLSGEADLQPDGLRERLIAADQAAGQYGSVVGALDYGAVTQDWFAQLKQDNEQNSRVENDYLIAGFITDKVVGAATDRIPVPVVGELADHFVGGILDEAKDAAMVDNSGLVTYGVSETLTDSRQASANLAVATLYHSGQLEGLPDQLAPDGTPKPIAEWVEADYEAWQGYASTTGRATVGDLAGTAAESYDDGVRRANEMLNHDVFNN